LKPIADIRSRPEDFVVEEIPAYEPCGSGGHVMMRVRKTGLTTLECVSRLARRFGVDPRDIGYAGMKDRHAVTTQTFSIPVAETRPIEQLGALDIEGVELLHAARHGNKLRTGHLRGNRFQVVLRNVTPAGDAPEVARALQETSTRGIPNAFGPQRFGRDGSNPQRAIEWLSGRARGPRAPREKRLLISSVQSMMFDDVLGRRVQDGTWDQVLAGDVARRNDNGALFDTDGGEQDKERARQGEISATGPMFGPRMRWPSGSPADLERSVLREHLGEGELLESFGKIGPGTRRALRILPGGLEITVPPGEPSTMVVRFELPKGAYATTVLGSVCGLRDTSRNDFGTPAEISLDDELLQHTPSESG
jgi:tRNA pseudouridine13 synthase